MPEKPKSATEILGDIRNKLVINGLSDVKLFVTGSQSYINILDKVALNMFVKHIDNFGRFGRYLDVASHDWNITVTNLKPELSGKFEELLKEQGLKKADNPNFIKYELQGKLTFIIPGKLGGLNETCLDYYDENGYTYIGLCDILEKFVHIFNPRDKTNIMSAEKQEASYARMIVILNFALGGLLNKNYYSTVKPAQLDKLINSIKVNINELRNNKIDYQKLHLRLINKPIVTFVEGKEPTVKYKFFRKATKHIFEIQTLDDLIADKLIYKVIKSQIGLSLKYENAETKVDEVNPITVNPLPRTASATPEPIDLNEEEEMKEELVNNKNPNLPRINEQRGGNIEKHKYEKYKALYLKLKHNL